MTPKYNIGDMLLYCNGRMEKYLLVLGIEEDTYLVLDVKYSLQKHFLLTDLDYNRYISKAA
jgi:hypothetical protein